MTMVQETILREKSIVSRLGQDARIQHVHSLGPVRVDVPALPTGRHFFELWPVRELPDQGMWAASQYTSFAPPVFVLRDVLVHSSAGILAVGDTVLGESLAYTTPQEHAYRALARGIALPAGPIEALPGTHISLLAAGETDYRHAVLNGLARLTAVPDNYVLASESLLVPGETDGATDPVCRKQALQLLDLMPSLSIRPVAQAESVRVETLVLPLSVCGEAAYHPCLLDFYRRISGNVATSSAPMPRRLYIDQRGNGVRPLRTETALIAALAELGFVPVKPDQMSLADQVRLFRQAEAIVSPHGPALTNLGFCRPGCLIVELLMDAYVDWGFRNLAALAKLRYDCVLGRAQKPWGELSLQFHLTPWDISVNHVVAAVMHSLGAGKPGALAA
jgi:capsular polysaccharide biosynthesis protein